MLTPAIRVQAAQRLCTDADLVRNADLPPVCRVAFDCTELAEGFDRGVLAARVRDSLPGIDRQCPVLYAIFANQVEDVQRLVLSFEAWEDGGAAHPTLNIQRDGPCLYVGSSNAIRTRLSQHLQTIPNTKTGALRMKDWVPNENIHLRVEIQPLPKIADRNLLVRLENTLWDALEPVFGQRGDG